ncbi:MAG: tetratricopeptide repeat protein [Ignavibacteriaceae bacterium]
MTRKQLLYIVAICMVFSGYVVAQTGKIDKNVGKKLFYYEKYNEAKTFWLQYIKNYPDDAEAYYNLGRVYLQIEDLDSASIIFVKGSEIKTQINLNPAGLIEVNLIEKDTSFAMNIFRSILNSEEKPSSDLLNAIGYALLKGGADYYSTAFAIMDKSISFEKKNYHSYFYKGELYYLESDGNNAIANYQKALDINPSFLPAMIGQGKVYNKIRNFTAAENTFLSILEIDSLYSPAYRELSSLFYSLKQYDKAEQNFKKYIECSEGSLKNKTRYSSLLYQIKDYAQAVVVCNEVLKSDFLNFSMMQLISYCYYELGDSDKGIPAFESFINITQPNNISATDYEYYGTLLAKAGRDFEAVRAYNNSILKDSSRTNIYGLLAASYFKLKNWKDCYTNYEFKETKSGKPLSLREYFDFGQAYFYDKQYLLADTVFFKVTQIKSDLALGYLWRAFSNAQRDTTSELGLAKPHYEKFVELASLTPDKYKNQLIQAYSYMGYYVFLKKDDPEYISTWLEKYKFYWTKVKELDPNNLQATEALKNVK